MQASNANPVCQRHMPDASNGGRCVTHHARTDWDGRTHGESFSPLGLELTFRIARRGQNEMPSEVAELAGNANACSIELVCKSPATAVTARGCGRTWLRGPTLISVTCEHCGEQFEYKYRGNGHPRRYCSKTCYMRWYRWETSRLEPVAELAGEEWRPVHNYEGWYEVSSLGRVRSVSRIIDHPTGPTRLQGKIIKSFTVEGYQRLRLNRGGRGRSVSVHILVCEAFHGPRPSPELKVRHLNGIGSDNRPENMAWGTHQENMLDIVRHGNHAMAHKTHCKRGHEFTPENTRRKPGGRSCRACERLRSRQYQHRSTRDAAR